MRIGYIQNSPLFGAKEQNFREISSLLKNVKADLLVLPELFATGYTFTDKKEARKLAETKDGETATFLKHISNKTGAIVVAGFIEKEAGKIYNSSMIVFGSKVIGTYRKIHLFNKEKLWFAPGNKPFPVYKLKGFKIGIMVCFDWMFPEAMRTLTLQGAQVIAHPANLVMPYCQNSMITRCLENRVFAVTANRIGLEKRGEDSFAFTGASQITSFDGKILSAAPKDKKFIGIVEINNKKADNKFINQYNNVIKDRKPKFYIGGLP